MFELITMIIIVGGLAGSFMKGLEAK